MAAVAGAPYSPWLTVSQAAKYIGCGPKLIYREIAAKRLRAASIGGRRIFRIKVEWVDRYLEAMATPVEVTSQPAIRRVG